MKPSARNCITKGLSESERYAQLAEECNELGKAALKIRRIITPGASPTLRCMRRTRTQPRRWATQSGSRKIMNVLEGAQC